MYGGHITDAWDRRTCNSYLSVLVNEKLFYGLELGPGFASPNPTELDYKDYLAYVEERLPPGQKINILSSISFIISHLSHFPFYFSFHLSYPNPLILFLSFYFSYSISLILSLLYHLSHSILFFLSLSFYSLYSIPPSLSHSMSLRLSLDVWPASQCGDRLPY